MAAQSKALRRIAEDAPNYPDYKPLDNARREIRLLDLGNDFRYTLRHASLEDRPFYVALSYYWGVTGVTKVVWVNGFEIKLRKTVYQFLKSLYRQFGDTTIWLDVLCINQRDVEEQGSQVSMMGDIYESASCVCAWLGTGITSTEYALRQLAVPGSINLQPKRRRLWDNMPPVDIDGIVRKASMHEVLDGLEYIFLQPYWARLWIIQEFVLNPTLFIAYGAAAVEWDVLAEIMHRCFDLPSQDLAFCRQEVFKPTTGTAWDTFRVFDHARTGFKKDQAMIELIYQFRAARCTDRLDKIYGLRSLAMDAQHIQVDYTSSLFSLVVNLVSRRNRDLFDLARGRGLVRSSQVGSRPGNYIHINEEEPLTDILTLGCFVCDDLALSREDVLLGLDDMPNDWLVLDVEPVPWFEMKQSPSGNWLSIFTGLCFLADETGNNVQEQRYTIDPRGLTCYRTVADRNRSLPVTLRMGFDIDGHCVDIELDLNRSKTGSRVTEVNGIQITQSGPVYGCCQLPIRESEHGTAGSLFIDEKSYDEDRDNNTSAKIRGLAKFNVWPCRVRNAVHISRMFFALLVDVDAQHRMAHMSDGPQSLQLPDWLIHSWEACGDKVYRHRDRECREEMRRCNCKENINCEGLQPPTWLQATLAEQEQRVWLERRIEGD